MTKPAEAEVPTSSSGHTTKGADAAFAPVSPLQAIDRARAVLGAITSQALDSVVSCQLGADGWTVVLDVIEVPARMGDNDLLVPYVLHLSPGGELSSFSRGARYHREERAS